MESNDEIVDLKIRTNSVFYAETEEEAKELKKIKKVKTRIIKTIIPSGEEEHLSTNLNKEELSEIEAKELYYGRWEIEKDKDLKYEYKINMNVMVGIFKERLMEIVLSPAKELEKKADEFNEEIKEYLVPIKPGRTYPRKRMHSMNKYRHNLRKNC